MTPPKQIKPSRHGNRIYMRTLFDLPQEEDPGNRTKYQEAALFLPAFMEDGTALYVYTTCVMRCTHGFPFAAIVHGGLARSKFDRNQYTADEVLEAIYGAKEIRPFHQFNNAAWIGDQQIVTKSGFNDTFFPFHIYHQMRWPGNHNIVTFDEEGQIVLDTGNVNWR